MLLPVGVNAVPAAGMYNNVGAADENGVAVGAEVVCD